MPTATTEADRGRWEGYRAKRLGTSSRNTLPGSASTSVAQGSEPLHGRLAEGRLGSDLLGPPEVGLGLLRPLLGGQHEPEVVVGRLQLGIQAQGKSQRILRLAVATEVEQRQAEILVRQVQDRQRWLPDRLAIGGHGVVPAPRLRKRRAEVEQGVAAFRVEIDGLVQFV